MTKLGKGIKRNYRVECIDKNIFKATALLYYTDALHNTEYSFNEKETIREIARIISGGNMSDVAIKHAEEMRKR